MRTFALSMMAGVALMAGVSAASATSTTVTTSPGGAVATTGAVTVDPSVETEVRTYVTRQHWTSADVPTSQVVVGHELPASVELHTVPKVEKYRVAVIGGRTVLVDPGTRKIVKVIER